MNNYVKTVSTIPRSLGRQLVDVYFQIRPRSINSQKNYRVVCRDVAWILRNEFHLRFLKNLKEKHIKHIIGIWIGRQYKASSLVCRISILRKICKLIGKSSCIKTNGFYGIKREPAHFVDKRWSIDGKEDFEIINSIGEQYHKYGMRIRYCLILQRLFGLRKREALQFFPRLQTVFDSNYNVTEIRVLRGAKNARYRHINIVNDKQRNFIVDLLKEFPFEELKPAKIKEYKKWERIYFLVLKRAGIVKNRTGHGLRQAYANERLPIIIEQIRQDNKKMKITIHERYERELAYKILAEELGHNRIDILKSYLADYKPINQ